MDLADLKNGLAAMREVIDLLGDQRVAVTVSPQPNQISAALLNTIGH